MAELLKTRDIMSALDNIILNAQKFICIFTYHIKIDDHFMSRLRNASKRGVRIDVFFGVQNGNEAILDSLQNIPNCTVYFKPYLHAKCYYNEKELLIGSMNLSDYSSANNYELAVLFKDEEYKQAIQKVKSEAKEIFTDAMKWEDRDKYESSSKLKTGRAVKAKDRPAASKNGHCIRCATKIPFNLEKPFCFNCYSVWQEWENEYYEEEYDHLTGENSKGETCFAKPILRKNWKREFEGSSLPF